MATAAISAAPAITRRGSWRSAVPCTASASAPTTKPICTALDSAAARPGVSPASATMSGRIAAETNQRLIASTCAAATSATLPALPAVMARTQTRSS